MSKVAIVAVVALAFVICALGLVIPVDNVSVAADTFVDTALVFNRVPIVAVVICALAVVIPVDTLSVADVILVETEFVFKRVPIVAVGEAKLVTCAEPATSRLLLGFVVPIPIFPDVNAILLEKLVHCEPGEYTFPFL